MNASNRYIELLAPARDSEVAIEAVKHGADAVYMGANAFGARSLATNTVDDLARVADFAHRYDARLYATVNTIVYDHELTQVERLIKALYAAGVDALIVQDMSLLRLDLPPIDLHASTQCDIRTPDKARFLSQLGFSQLVLARELSLTEIEAISQSTQAKLEAFVHGALCVCYSGRCQASQVLLNRSANRGECAQLCRLPYDLIDDNGQVLLKHKHLLSLRDLNRSMHLREMIDAGVSSFKIEGRLKDVRYVKNVTSFYRRLLDEIIDADDTLHKSSKGTSIISFTPDLSKSFNRRFTDYFLTNRKPTSGVSMASVDTAKSMGEEIGVVTRSRGKTLAVDTHKPLANGDGLSYFDGNDEFCGVRVNRVDGNRVYLKDAVELQMGTKLYRTADKCFDDVLRTDTAQRLLWVDATLEAKDSLLRLTLNDERGCQVSHSVEVAALQPAKVDQTERQTDALAKLGGTGYMLRHANVMGETFVPASILTQLRRDAVMELDTEWRRIRKVPKRLPEQRNAQAPSIVLVSSDNVANHLAEELYRSHGVKEIKPAIECNRIGTTSKREVMVTRYCVRRELNACLLDKSACHNLPRAIKLRASNFTLEVECDCKKCEMHLFLIKD